MSIEEEEDVEPEVVVSGGMLLDEEDVESEVVVSGEMLLDEEDVESDVVVVEVGSSVVLED